MNQIVFSNKAQSLDRAITNELSQFSNKPQSTGSTPSQIAQLRQIGQHPGQLGQLGQLRQLKQPGQQPGRIRQFVQPPQPPQPAQPAQPAQHPEQTIIAYQSDSYVDAIETYFKNSTFNCHIGLYDTWPTINNAEKEIL
jgi:hypothetical protein